MSRNNVRGPTSALTEFLKASGITPTTIARRAATRRDQEQPAAGPSTAPDTAQAAEAQTNGGSSRSRSRRSVTATRSGYASDNLDDDEEEAGGAEMEVDEPANETPPKKRKRMTKAEEAKLKAKEKEKMKKRKKGKGDDDDYDDDDDEDDTYTAPSRSMWNPAAKPPVGNFENCASCSKQFTVTKYTLAKSGGGGWLCHQCAKAGGQDPFKKQPAPKRRKAPADKRTVTHFEEKRFPTLVSLCVQLIAKHIDDVEAFGDIGSLNVEAIAKALSKSRELNAANAQLFYAATNERLTFYDATNLDSPAFETLAYQNANLRSLRLDFCGQLNDAALKVFSTSLPNLERIELLGPFLVRSEAWQDFFKSHPNLQGFLITQSPRFDMTCVSTLTKHCPNITEIRLKEIGQMSDGFLSSLSSLKKGVWSLDIADPSNSCSDSAVIALLKAIGSTLRHLNLSNHVSLTDKILTKGFLPYLRSIESLTLSHLPELTNAALASFFSKWANPGLRHVDLSRNEELSSEALEALIKHSGGTLEGLDINGWKDVSGEVLTYAGVHAVELRKADVSWCREFDDFVLRVWLEGEEGTDGMKTGGCLRLQEIKVWGCNRLSDGCPRKRGVIIRGVETHQVR